MIYKDTRSSHSLIKKLGLELKPPLAWTAILGLIFISTVCILTGFSKILNFVFPVGSVAVGVLLYDRYPILYLGFTWWVWFLSPFIARVVEYQNGWSNPSFRLIILAPYLVTLISSLSFFRYLPKIYKKQGLPFFICFLCLIYSLFVGLIRNESVVQSIEQLLSWITGIFFGFHLMVNWRDYPSYRQNTQRIFLWGTLVMGSYGIVQYLVPIKWDQFWLRSSENLISCCGWPDPWNIRVWSTLNYPFTFGYTMLGCLILALTSKSSLKIVALLVGLLSFLLSRVRGAWIGFSLSLLLFILSLNSRNQMRYIIMILLIIICLYPLVTLNTFSEDITSRLQTLTDAQEDRSLSVRANIYAELFNKLIVEFIGNGMGGPKVIDAGFFDVLSNLGWLGVIPFMSGVFLIFYRIFQYPEVRYDLFVAATRSIPVGIFITLPFNNSLKLLPGVIFWAFSGLTIAAHQYYQHQKMIDRHSEKYSLTE